VGALTLGKATQYLVNGIGSAKLAARRAVCFTARGGGRLDCAGLCWATVRMHCRPRGLIGNKPAEFFAHAAFG